MHAYVYLCLGILLFSRARRYPVLLVGLPRDVEDLLKIWLLLIRVSALGKSSS